MYVVCIIYYYYAPLKKLELIHLALLFIVFLERGVAAASVHACIIKQLARVHCLLLLEESIYAYACGCGLLKL